MANVTNNYRKITFFTIFIMSFAGILLIDAVLPARQTQEIVSGHISYRIRGKNSSGKQYGLQTNEGRLPVPLSLYGDVIDGDSIIVFRTGLLSIPRSFTFNSSVYKPLGVHSFYCIPLLLAFLLALCGFMLRKKDSLALYLVVSLAILIGGALLIILVQQVYIAAS